ncbi:hypothetical protein [Inmirania thermothiophila]|uniref:Polysaccharide deacetylase n=1 Tax=Inmirania thermothiophila TaxID=1750597 RepID=A0A3N1XSI7_9GAMM|nr:hypothetical protein [Inmirania thermothiophila]ROR29620.1 hypothetical protein EDC57_2291 [Inmirania thermothiophila]
MPWKTLMERFSSSALFTFLAVAGLFHAPAWADTSVLVTVDVESYTNGDPSLQVLGAVPDSSEPLGVPFMARRFAELGIRGTFYVNVYERAKYGDTVLRRAIRDILAYGHEIGLHTHPQPTFGPGGLSRHPLAIQKQILAWGRDLLSDWSGMPILIHRAGGYMANLDTLQALQALGFVADASLAPSVPSPLSKQIPAPYNDVAEIEEIVELPVTYYAQIRLGPYESLRLVDIESSSAEEILAVLAAFARRNGCAVNIMMHSFSLTRYGKADRRPATKLARIAQFVHENESLQFRGTREFLDGWRRGAIQCTPARDFVPTTGLWLTYLRAWERFGDGWKNAAMALSPAGAVSFALLILLLRRRKNLDSPVARARP